jgi:hypothetical protein
LCLTASGPRTPALAVAFLSVLVPAGASAQGSAPGQGSGQSIIGARVDALTILGGDFGFSDGDFHSRIPTGSGLRSDLSMEVTKIGGDGDIGDPRPLNELGIGWQPRVQGSAGYLESSYHVPGPQLAGDVSKLYASSVEFGGGFRFWTTNRLSFAPTLMVLYGHTTNSYWAQSAYALANLATLRKLGLIDWSIGTLSLRPALNIQYVLPWGRSRITISSDGAAFVTRTLTSARINAAGDSGFLTHKLDLDIPLGVGIDGHELRSGGYISRTELFGQLQTGLAVQHLNEFHGRLVADFLNQVWRVQWLGLGASYIWGPNIHGWSWGADVTFRF